MIKTDVDVDIIVKDSSGNNLHVGDRVQLVSREYSYPRFELEQLGIVRGITNSSNVAVEFDYGVVGNDLHGLLKGEEAYRGCYLYSQELLKLAITSNPDTLLLKNNWFKDLIKTKDDCFIRMDGTVYKLSKGVSIEQDIIGSLERETAEIIRQFHQSFKSEEIALKEQLNSIVQLPDVSFQQLNHYKVTLYRHASCIGYVFPFLYNPQWISGHAARYALSPKSIETLKRDLLLNILILPTGKFNACYLYATGDDLIQERSFSHYHGSCLGTMKMDTITDFASLVAFRDRYQEMLQTINSNDLASHNPTGLPTFTSLFSKAKQIFDTESGVFDQNTNFDPESTTELGSYNVGDFVRVMNCQDSFPPDALGVIGQVISIENDVTSVEFCFSLPDFHSGLKFNGAFNRCYDFNKDKLLKVTDVSRRTSPSITGINYVKDYWDKYNLEKNKGVIV